MKRFLNCFILVLAVMLLTAGIKVEAAQTAEPDLGYQNWGTDWDKKVLIAKGEAAGGANARTPAQERLQARIAAIAYAQKALTEAINQVSVEAGVIASGGAYGFDYVSTQSGGILKGAVVIWEKWDPVEKTFTVYMQVPLFGNSGVATAVFPPKNNNPQPFPAPEVIPSTSAESQTTGVINVTGVGDGANNLARGNYTGLIIDCRNLGLNPVMSPVIKNSSGVKLYVHENLNYDLIIRDGMVNYVHSQSQAGRAGSNPLILRAERLEDNNANPVVRVNDGNRILIENGSTGFLNKTAVVFLY